MTIELVDVSRYQTYPADAYASLPDWVAGVIAKATEGNAVDPHWAANNAALRNNPKHVFGAYHVADFYNSPQFDAQAFLNVVHPTPGMILALDAETVGGDANWCRAWMNYVEAATGGYKPWFYSYRSWMTSRGITLGVLGDNPLWLAWPDTNGPLPIQCSMQQYAADTGVADLNRVDRNRFFGTIDQLRALTIGGADDMFDDAAKAQLAQVQTDLEAFIGNVNEFASEVRYAIVVDEPPFQSPRAEVVLLARQIKDTVTKLDTVIEGQTSLVAAIEDLAKALRPPATS